MTCYNAPPFHTNGEKNDSIFSRRIRKPYKTPKRTKVPWEPIVVNNVPKE